MRDFSLGRQLALTRAGELALSETWPSTYGLGTSTSRQILCAVNSLISRWRAPFPVHAVTEFLAEGEALHADRRNGAPEDARNGFHRGSLPVALIKDGLRVRLEFSDALFQQTQAGVGELRLFFGHRGQALGQQLIEVLLLVARLALKAFALGQQPMPGDGAEPREEIRARLEARQVPIRLDEGQVRDLVGLHAGRTKPCQRRSQPLVVSRHDSAVIIDVSLADTLDG